MPDWGFCETWLFWFGNPKLVGGHPNSQKGREVFSAMSTPLGKVFDKAPHRTKI